MELDLCMKQERSYVVAFSDWSSGVCASYLGGGGVRRAQRRAGGCRGGVARATVLNPLPVGWVERRETHRLPGNQGTMGFAALYPSYDLVDGSGPISPAAA